MMLGKAVLCLVLISGAAGNWVDGSDDPTYSNLGFYVVNLTCSDDGSQCAACYNVHVYSRLYQHVFEYAEHPYKFQYASNGADREFKITHIQDDQSELFRACSDSDDIDDFEYGSIRISMCIDNYFSEVPVPAECTKPIAVLSVFAFFQNTAGRGQQTLYCAPTNE